MLLPCIGPPPHSVAPARQLIQFQTHLSCHNVNSRSFKINVCALHACKMYVILGQWPVGIRLGLNLVCFHAATAVHKSLSFVRAVPVAVDDGLQSVVRFC